MKDTTDIGYVLKYDEEEEKGILLYQDAGNYAKHIVFSGSNCGNGIQTGRLAYYSFDKGTVNIELASLFTFLQEVVEKKTSRYLCIKGEEKQVFDIYDDDDDWNDNTPGSTDFPVLDIETMSISELDVRLNEKSRIISRSSLTYQIDLFNLRLWIIPGYPLDYYFGHDIKEANILYDLFVKKWYVFRWIPVQCSGDTRSLFCG